ncbi:MAG: hypothetical protein IPK39_07790 [Sulfuritalea sp.]|nr:hypothetical protein [Sulfuritalea sp.]
MMAAFRRSAYSTIVFASPTRGAPPALLAAIDADPRLQDRRRRKIQFYAEQSEALATFIRYLGLFLSLTFLIGAIVG